MQQAEETKNHLQTHLGEVRDLLGKGTVEQLRQMIRGLRPVEVARLIESTPPPSRDVIWDLAPKDSLGEIIDELPEEIRGSYLSTIDAKDIAEITEGLAADDIVDILQALPETVITQVLEAMDNQDRERVETILNYPEDTAGGLTDTDVITVRPRYTLDVVLRYLRRHEELPPSTDSLIVVNRKDDYLGMLPLSTLLTADPSTTVREVMINLGQPIKAEQSNIEVAELFEKNDWVSAPVVDASGKLLGRITIDDVVDVIRDDADHSLMSLAGLDEDDDTFASVTRTTPRRAIWLGMNLITAILASSVINIFQDAIEKVVALAVLMPIVASMGGVAGSQTLTMVIRGMATGRIGKNNLAWLVSRELQVGLINGILWALVMGILAGLWFGDPVIPLVLGFAMIINLLTAAIAGAALPSILKALNIDPALAGGVTLTTITDVVGFMSFLGLATLFYA